MKALVLNGYGDNRKLAIENRPKPSPGPNQILIRVKNAGLNPLDFKIRSGKLRAIRKLKFPHIMGNEVAGTVEAVGEGVTKFKPKDIVYTRLDKGRMGGFAEFVAENERFVAPAPNSVPIEVAAGIPLVALTAWQCVVEVGKLNKNQKILVHGGAGSVGRYAIQFSKHIGAHVTATGNEPSRSLISDLGADRFVDYRKEKFECIGEKFDLVLDLVGADTLDRSFLVVREGGQVISIAGKP